jgi:hypothetical protein
MFTKKMEYVLGCLEGIQAFYLHNKDKQRWLSLNRFASLFVYASLAIEISD